MAAKIKLLSPEHDNAEAEFIGRVDAVGSKRYASLRLRLEEFGVVD
jgi:hypothetical protein